jgi:hypothetical protein
MLEQFAAWRDGYRDRMESFEFFIRGGGFGIVNFADEAELRQMMLEYPFFITGKVEVHVIMDGDEALRQTREALARMAARAS